MIKHILFILILILYVNCQNPQPQNIPTQNFIEPTIVTPNNSIPAQEIMPNQNQQQPDSSNSQTQQQNNIPNPNMHGLEGQNIPVNNQPVHENNNGQHQRSQQQIDNAKQQAQKARQMAEQARRQAQADRQKRQQSQDQQMQRIRFDTTISLTERKKQQQRLHFRKIARQVQLGTQFSQYLFEQAGGASQFFVKIPATQQVALNLYTYVAQDNTYVRTKNIQQEQPVKVYIYENNERIIYQGQFYYQTYIVFEGKAGGMYLMRIYNQGKPKLISMNVKKMIQDRHLQETLKKHDAGHVQRTLNLAVQVNRWYQQFRKIRMLDYQDLKAVEGYIHKYYSWEIIQTIIAVIFCAVQISLIRNMLKGSSIV